MVAVRLASYSLLCKKAAAKDEGLVIFERHHHFKGRNGYFEDFFIVEIFHLVSTHHAAHFCAKVAATDILVFLTWVKRWLNPHNAFSVYLAVLAIAIKYLPMAAVKFNGKIILVLYGDSVSKHKLRLQWVRVVWLVESFYTYFYAF